jgi:uncharacterized membrane protein
VKKYSIRPALTLRGRTFKGLRGWAGKPSHPPLTDFPIAAYLFGAGFDAASALAGRDHAWARELWHAATFTFVGGAGISVLTVATGWVDRQRSSRPGTQAWRTINTHATVMGTVTALAIADIAWRIHDYDRVAVTPMGIAILSVVIAVLVSLGATYGGSLVYDYGFNVETAGDHAVWHVSEDDEFPGGHADPAIGSAGAPPASLDHERTSIGGRP